MADQAPKIYPRTKPDRDDFLKKVLEAQLQKSSVNSDEDLERQKKIQEIEQASQTHKDTLEERKQERQLRGDVAKRIFRLLVIETIVVFLVLFLQGFKFFGFNLNNTTLNIFLPATIIQISSMAVIITRSLFPGSKNK